MSAIDVSRDETLVVPPATTTAGEEPWTPPDSRRWLVVLLAGFATWLGFLLLIAERGPGDLAAEPTTTNLVDGVPRANEPFLGWEYWPYTWEILTVLLVGAALFRYGRRSWRARQMDNTLLVLFAAGGMFAFDPVYNWLGYFPTDPRLLHIPHGFTPWSNIAPTFEPIFFMPLYMIWLTFPALLGHKAWKRFMAWDLRRNPEGSWWQRHKILSLLIVCKVVTTPWDFTGFRLGVVTEIFIFSQAPGPLWDGGESSQMQLLWEPLLFPLVIMGTTLCLYRDETGRTIPQRIAERFSFYRTIPRFSQWMVAWCIIAVFYVAALTGMGILRFTGQTDTVAQPWPYSDTVVYDPDGLYEQLGAPGEKRGGDLNWDIRRPSLGDQTLRDGGE